MEPDEIENAAEAANDTVEHSEGDTSEDFVYFDPDEQQETETPEEPEETDDETDEAEAEDEAEDQESEDQDEESPDDVTVTLDDGTAVPLGELKKGYFRQSDYSRKTAEVAETRKQLDASTQRIQGVTQAFVEHLANILPPEPDQALAFSDPNKHYQQSQVYNNALAQVQKLIEIGSDAKSVADDVSQVEADKTRQQENAKLAEMFPATAKDETRTAFFHAANDAASSLGFSPEELGSVTDHRMIALAHWAKIGMQAQEAKTKAKAKAKKAPPASTRKPGGTENAAQNANAMQKLKKSGSLDDAMLVDFD